jgi:two-component system response regulator YesN
LRIVVVEDGIKIRRGIIHLIEKLSPDFKVVGEAANGLDGLKIIDELKPDLVIADIRMAELGGLEMLQVLKERESKHKTIILSAFSDFSFAQQAISLGVSEYLLKPVTAEKMQKSLITIERELLDERDRNQASLLFTVKHLFQDLLLGKTEKIKELRQIINTDGNFEWIQPYVLIAAYTGNRIYDNEELQQAFSQLLSADPGIQYLILEGEVNGLTLMLVSCKSGLNDIETLLAGEFLDNIHRRDFPNLVMGWIAAASLEELPTKLQQLSEIFKWALLLSKDQMITQSAIAGFDVQPIVYPAEIERQAVAEVSRRHFQNLAEIFGNFLSWWTRGYYYPDQIIAAFVQFISSITNAVKETDLDLFKRLKQQEILKQVLNAITMDQLEAVLWDLQKKLCLNRNDPQSAYSLPVIRALKIIAENYQAGISREGIAARLHITPEYFSMLFYKEVGRTFTAYLKHYRINKAKELLTQTELKIYEIAEKVGYWDPKYFCRVFKEVTGVSAGEYQKYFLGQK